VKEHHYKCDSARVTAMAVIREHQKAYPDGINHLREGRSRSIPYPDLGYVIYETKTLIVINELGAR
jgi:hypothetical protein